MKKLLVFLFFITSFCFAQSSDLSNKIIAKKINKTISQLFPELTVDIEPILIDEQKVNALKLKKEEKAVYALKNGSKILGYMYLGIAPSRADFFDYMVIFKPDLYVMSVQVLVYREDYGGEIGSKRWLKQFVGKSNGEQMEFEKDIQNIGGATISCRSITNGIKKLSKNIVEMRKLGIL
jgi:Na+-translocating ferredoxin:NAD+ oxidoreductase RnfG subunit